MNRIRRDRNRINLCPRALLGYPVPPKEKLICYSDEKLVGNIALKETNRTKNYKLYFTADKERKWLILLKNSN